MTTIALRCRGVAGGSRVRTMARTRRAQGGGCTRGRRRAVADGETMEASNPNQGWCFWFANVLFGSPFLSRAGRRKGGSGMARGGGRGQIEVQRRLPRARRPRRARRRCPDARRERRRRQRGGGRVRRALLCWRLLTELADTPLYDSAAAALAHGGTFLHRDRSQRPARSPPAAPVRARRDTSPRPARARGQRSCSTPRPSTRGLGGC